MSVAKRGNIIQEVSVTGTISPITGADAAFEEGGTVSSVLVSVGDAVSRGQELARLDPGDLYAKLDEAKAALAVEQANLANVEQGSTPQAIAVKQAALAQAEQDLDNAYGSVVQAVHDAYAQGDNAVRTETVGMFDASYRLTYNACNASLENTVEQTRQNLESTLYQWGMSVNALSASSTNSELSAALTLSWNNLVVVSGFLNNVSNTLLVGCDLSNTEISTYRTAIDAARTNVSTALSSVDALRQEIALKAAAVTEAQRELENTEAGPTDAAVQAQEAAVQKAAAGVDAANAAIENTILTAPFAGTVTRVDVKRGDVVAAYAPLITIVGTKGFEIKANIAEVDIANVKAGETARVTLDAYGDSVDFAATVASVDTSETVIEGVPTYETTLYFTKPDERIRSGMTANVYILTAEHDQVIEVPYRAVTRTATSSTVQVVRPDGTLTTVPVVTGLRGSDGSVEITSGLNEGDKVATILTP